MHIDDLCNLNRMTWCVEDPFPGVHLDTIAPISLRARSLLARSSPLLNDRIDCYRLNGSIDIMEGLEYHYSNWLRIINHSRSGMEYDGAAVTHEIIAYFNRLGQFYYFATSSFVDARVPDAIASLQEISRLIPFRHKIAAHRSIDQPRGQADQNEDERRFFAVNKGSLLIMPRNDQSKLSPPTGNTLDLARTEILKQGFPVYQLSLDPLAWIQFAPERDHDLVMADCFSLYSHLLQNA
jgi:hypothetical protein